jgi:excisionase family DNA binding protein
MMTREARRERETKKATGGETWLTAEEAAQHLRLSIPTLYRLSARGDLPVYHVGRSRRYRLRDLDALPRRQEGPCNA